MIELRLYAIRRSGHHAIINWLFEQLSGSVVVANNISFTGHNSTKSYIKCIEEFKNKTLKPNGNSNLIAKNFSGDIDFLISNIEDEKLEFSFKKNDFHKQIGIGTGLIKNIIVLRDAYNCIASRIRKDFKINYNTSHSDKWVSYAKEFVRETNNLPNAIRINYNKWYTSQEYRRRLSGILEIPFSDSGLQKVPSYGGGSSFDGVHFNNQSQNMKVLQRYKFMIGNSEFASQIQNSDLHRLNETIFKTKLNLPKIFI